MSQFHQLKINAVQKATENAVTIGFEVPDSLRTSFQYKAGQYITLRATINNEEVRRDYSICSAPKSGKLVVAVKEVVDGTFSKFANRVLKVGDLIDVSAPNGRFIFEPNVQSNRTVAAFAAGSGITPIMSIAKSVLEEEPNSKFVLIYGNKSPKDTIFLDEILELQNTYGERFYLKLVFSQSQEPEALFGRIEKSTVNFILKNQYKDRHIDAFYICGPEQMIYTVKDVLLENTISEDAIHFELFTVPTTDTDEVTESLPNGKTKITVLIDDEESTFVMDQTKTLLEASLDKDLDAPYSCQGGICSSCIARITEGNATMRQNNILTDGEVAEGLILTCQAHPTSTTIVVDYDDV
ncbi:ferredoxin--NADP reductase [Psychroserpens sp.]|uniref:ferredoxin--NADP reductase n=1 Tax=Psychroserpens sp. TaxID=2020870 RepID=UPI001B2EC90C|nr:ferredoxin--NADP reductase [Psychroserpens sp.]MBO6605413.1 ferredoxin--NADP reductase [Psychroserpens sp.]MBO6653778.1 ferredoxin--NADP reductase [Psychroserpens sp.]MBO6682099.1 ferredoxin--NADP reductase [Psychroserpens sp.]MBO6748787.1 ferredoxin--NADP reductase [Psychroserpens sp.]MBO6915306.1 ferredoxin--NADP reductase [Psychroserpens sp.]